MVVTGVSYRWVEASSVAGRGLDRLGDISIIAASKLDPDLVFHENEIVGSMAVTGHYSPTSGSNVKLPSSYDGSRSGQPLAD